MAKTLYSQSGKIEYGIKKYTVDTEADKEALNLKTTKMGSKCYVIDTKKWYILNSSNQWIPFVDAGGSGGNGSPFDIKGSVPTIDDLPTEDNAIGDLYIVQEDHSEWVWMTNSENPGGYWEQLGINISPDSIVNATVGMTPIQKEKTRNNIGAIGAHNPIIYSPNIYSPDFIPEEGGSGVHFEVHFINGVPIINFMGDYGDEPTRLSSIENPQNPYDAANKQYVDSRTFVITVTYDNVNDEYTADKTFSEIQAAYEAGKILFAKNDIFFYNLSSFEYEDNATFVTYGYDEGVLGKITFVEQLRINSDNSVDYAYIESPSIPTTVTVTGTTPTITPADNTVYKCGELTSLTISNPPVTGKYSIIFFSGATATTTVGIENFVAEANKRYKITVEDNYATNDSWPYTPA